MPNLWEQFSDADLDKFKSRVDYEGRVGIELEKIRRGKYPRYNIATRTVEEHLPKE